ncbi:dual specificity protein phosphatase family protein [Acaryochloris sp. IP29b_bin.137]|uniref:protein-tyrosine phosphatase family protein n=1 Tax=Acaryochloris sp. IP29b_bin.137 TaxID=2969217 RepID=UPI00261A96DD|nr:dual specificity protein phosphatase family protein [Acaryochloris sp. IP29b_bin.137]
MKHNSAYKFAAASKSEPLIFGAARPGYDQEQVADWIRFMQNQKIQGVCCLLSKTELVRYMDLLGNYRQAFGNAHVCWAPIEDFSLATSESLLREILPFLGNAVRERNRVVVHCSGGVGRTGHVLAAWLVAGRGFQPKSALFSVMAAGRNPYEAILAAPFKGHNPWQVSSQLNRLFKACTHFQQKPI